MLEGHLAADRRQCRPPGLVGRLGRGVENIAEPRHRKPRLMEILPDLGEAQHRRADPPGQHIEGDQLADRQVAVDDELGAEIEHPGGDELVDELHALGSPCCRG